MEYVPNNSQQAGWLALWRYSHWKFSQRVLLCPGCGFSFTRFGSLVSLRRCDQFRLTFPSSLSWVRRKIPQGWKGRGNPDHAHSTHNI